jgi:PAS domain S-box-containing protein
MSPKRGRKSDRYRKAPRRVAPRKRAKSKAPAAANGHAELERLTHELQVHQEELDIQNRQLIESQRLLEDSRDRLATLYDFAPVPYVTFCNNGVIREINLTGATLLGYMRSHLIDRPFVLMIAEPYRRLFLSHLSACREGRCPLTTELVLKTGDSRQIPVELRTSGTLDAHGMPWHLSVLIDISDRHRLEEEKQRLQVATRSEQLLRTVLQSLPVGVRLVGPPPEGNTLLFNDACRSLWGIAAGKPLPSWHHQKGWNTIRTRRLQRDDWPLERALRGQQADLRQMLHIQCFDGSTRTVVQSAVPLLDNGGAIIGAVEVTEDVTPLLAAQDAARRRQEQLEAAFDAAHLSFWDWNLLTNRVTWSGPFEQLFGSATGAAHGLSEDLFQHVHSDDFDAVRRAIEQAREAQTTFEQEFRVRWRDQSLRWLSARGRFTYRGDQAVRMTGVVTDITARKTAEIELLRAKEAAEEASRVKDDFIATVSHELRTPLSAILLWTHLAQTSLKKESDKAAALEAIHQSANAQSQLVGDLLDISRSAAGKLRLNLRNAHIDQAIHAAIDAVRPSADARQIELQIDLNADLPPMHIDPDRIQQVAWNLLTNAIKFTGAGGRVTARLQRATGEHGEALVRLVVTDTGHGIAPEFLPQMFQRFRQADSGTTRMHGGLGLGLAIARELVQMHGGTIRADSDGLERGATFTVELPLHTAAKAEPSPAGPPARRRARGGV